MPGYTTTKAKPPGPTAPQQAGQHKRPLDLENTFSPNPKRQLHPNLVESDQGDVKAPRGPLRKHQEEEPSYSYDYSSSESPSDQAPDPAQDILLAGVRILQNVTKSAQPGSSQKAPTEKAQEETPPPGTDLVTEEADYDGDEDVCPVGLDVETNVDGEQVSCSPP
jgi:hypothetical protein